MQPISLKPHATRSVLQSRRRHNYPMENTGRIRKALSPSARQVIFSNRSESDVLEELWHMSRIDQAHLVMLAECGIVETDHCTKLIAAIDRLQKQNFSPVLQRISTRGLFLLYEDYL